MNERTKTGLQILQIAVVLGVAGDVLLRSTPWGLNVLIFNLLFGGAMAFLLWKRAPEQLTATTISLFGALIFFASMYVWRDAIELRIADTFAILMILGVLFLSTLQITPKMAGIFQYAIGFGWASVNSMFAPVALLATDISWNEMQDAGWRKHVFAVIRGVLVATPLIVIFGALFMAADAVYEGWIKTVLNVDFENLLSHGLLFAAFAWLSAGYFRGIIFAGVPVAAGASLSIVGSESPMAAESKVDKMRSESGEYPVTLPDSKTVVEHINISDPPNADADAKQSTNTSDASAKVAGSKNWSWVHIDNSIVPGFTLGTVEIVVILGLINLLFLSFVIVQVPYLFGGMELVQNTPDFKLADYARRGFGELVTVSALVLPILLASHWLIRKDAPLAGKLYKAFAGIQIALLFVIMASAVQRLMLLTGSLGYGLTTVRLYPLIFMTWLAVVFVWFAVTVLRGARQHFAWGALWSAFLILGATHVLNPDALIVKTNIALMQQGREFDARYNSDLSDDALPALFDAISEMKETDREIAIHRLMNRYCKMQEEMNFRSWNISRSNARSLLESANAFVETLGGCENLNKYDYVRYGVSD